jgi:flagellin-like hook-associated protein FlgL
MTITSYGTGAYRAASTNSFVSARGELNDLQRQLATQKRSESYGDLGIERRTSLDLNAKISSLDSWLDGIKLADVNLKLSSQAVENFAKLTSETRNDSRSNSYVPSASGRSAPQVMAEEKLKQSLDLLNTAVNGRYLFSGRTSDVEPVASFSEIMDGVGNQAGLKQLIKERQAADDITGQGHLAVGSVDPASPQKVTIAREAVDNAYGFTLTDIQGNSAAFTVDTVGLPASLSVNVDTQPAVGDTVRLTLKLPDGTTTEIALTARAAGSTGDQTTSFAIGANPTETAANLRGSVDVALRKEAQTTLRAASTSQTAQNFFEASTTNPPLRIPAPPATLAGPPVAGTAANTVIWYKGELNQFPATPEKDPARGTATVQVGQGQVVGTGARANEQAFAIGLAQFAVMTVETFPPGDPNSQAGYEAMIARVSDKLGFGGGVQKPAEIITELASAQTSLAQAKERNESNKNYLTTTVQGVENVTTEEVAVQILALQNRLQASYQTTSILSQLKLTNYL